MGNYALFFAHNLRVGKTSISLFLPFQPCLDIVEGLFGCLFVIEGAVKGILKRIAVELGGRKGGKEVGILGVAGDMAKDIA